MLKLKNISKNYITSEENVLALKDINLEFRENEFVAILGPSGCGKTTLLNIIGGLDKYSSGDLIINEISTKEYKDSDWDSYRNHKIGFVFQNYNLIPHLTVLGNVELALTLSGISKNERKKKAIEALNKVGLNKKINKMPNQLSGGEMQRVAIARAIVNNPQIILADEPTGALDTKTSIQIMDILKDLGKEKLVIMVTHNPNLAEQYSTRKIELVDGNIIKDTNPFVSDKQNKKEEKQEKTSMNFMTALMLSFKNLFTKKTRTIFTFIAGSVGIIGVALVLFISNGVDKYVDKMQADTLSSYPITIEQKTTDVEDILSAISDLDIDLDKYPKIKEVYVHKILDVYENMYTSNNITEEYINNVIKNIDKDLINGIIYNSGVELNFFTNNGMMKQISNNDELYVKLTTKYIWQEMIDNNEFISSQYDVIEGRLPTNYDEIVIVVDKYNQLMDATLLALGLYEEGQEKKKYTFEELMNLEFKVLTNDEMYIYSEGKYKLNGVEVNKNKLVVKEAYDSGIPLKVVGILRTNQSTNVGSLYSGVGYTSDLVKEVISKNKISSLAQYMLKEENINIDPFTGVKYVATSSDETVESLYKNALKKYGADDTAKKISIYPKSFEAKEKIKDYLNDYNKDKKEKDKIRYTDLMGIIIDTFRTMVDGISYVLIAFSSISLIVSTIMIAIITYVSVIERTKEIGVLRSIGARKKDVSRVFNAETFIIGLAAGVFGILVASLLTIPINLIVNSYLDGIGNVATPNIFYSIILVIISVFLTLLSGFIPSRIASNKDPVVALRSE